MITLLRNLKKSLSHRTVFALMLGVLLVAPFTAHAAALSISPTTASPNTNTTVTVSWSGVTSPTSSDWIALFVVGGTNYDYLAYKYIGTCSGVQSSGSCSFTVNRPAGSYEFRYLPNDGYASIATSQTLAIGASDTTAPTVPAGLSGTVISSTQINLTWTASTDAVGVTGYKIYRNGVQIGTSVGTSYSSTGLSPSTSYTYTVSAYDAAGNNSAQSASISRTTSAAADTTAPTVPTGLAGTVISSSQIDLTWTASTDAVGVTGYKIYRGGVQIGTSVGTSYSSTGLSPSTSYTYTVSAYDAAGNNSAQSASISRTTSAASTWIGPTQAAPGGNIWNPLNVGAVNQVKNANIAVNGLAVFGNTLLNPGAYLNWGTTAGSGGYGIRDNGGILEFKNATGTWQSIQTIISSLSASSTAWNSGPNGSIYYAAGGVAVGASTTPVSALDVIGFARLSPRSSAPVACDTSRTGSIAVSNATSHLCVCNGSAWVYDYNGGACGW